MSICLGADNSDLRLRIAEKLEAKGQFDQALQELRLFSAEHPERVEALVATARIQLKKGKASEAAESYRQALAKAPQDQAANLGLADALEKSGDQKGAAAEWRRMMALSPDPAVRKQAESRWRALSQTPAGVPSPNSKPPATEKGGKGKAGELQAKPTVAAKPADPKAHESKQTDAKQNATKQPDTKSPISKTTAAKTSVPELETSKVDAAHAGNSTDASKRAENANPEKSPLKQETPGADNPAVTPVAAGKPLPADPAYDAALNFYREGKKKEALDKIRQVLQRHPGHAGAYYLGGVIRYELGEMSKSAYNFKRSFDHPEKGYNAHYYLGRIYQKQGRKADAIKEFELYASTTPSETGKKQSLGFIEQLRGGKQVPGPKGEPEQVDVPLAPVAAKPEDSKSVHADTGAPAEAHERAKELAPPVRSQPGETMVDAPNHAPLSIPLENGFLFLIPDSLSNSGKQMRDAHALYRKDKVEKSVQGLQAVARDFGGTENADVALLNLAALYLKLSLWDYAITQLEAFTAGNPNRVSRYFGLANYLMGRALMGKNQYDKAERFFLKVKPGEAFSPSSEERDWQLAECAPFLKDPTARASHFDHALSSSTLPARRAWLRLRLGLLHAASGRTVKAMDFLKAVQEDCQSPDAKASCAEAQVRYADMAFKEQDYKTAMTQYQAFEKIYPKTADIPWVLYQIGNIHKVSSHLDLALNAYKRLIDNYPDSYWAAQAKWQREDAIWQKEYEEVLN